MSLLVGNLDNNRSITSSLLRWFTFLVLPAALIISAFVWAASSFDVLHDFSRDVAKTVTNGLNAASVATCLVISAVMFWLSDLHKNPLTKSLSLGISLVALGWAIHRGWWLMGVLTLPEGSTDSYAQWAIDYRLVLIGVNLLVQQGYAQHTKRLTEVKLGRYWWVPIHAVGVLAFLLMVV